MLPPQHAHTLPLCYKEMLCNTSPPGPDAEIYRHHHHHHNTTGHQPESQAAQHPAHRPALSVSHLRTPALAAPSFMLQCVHALSMQSPPNSPCSSPRSEKSPVTQNKKHDIPTSGITQGTSEQIKPLRHSRHLEGTTRLVKMRRA